MKNFELALVGNRLGTNGKYDVIFSPKYRRIDNRRGEAGGPSVDAHDLLTSWRSYDYYFKSP